MRRSSNTSTSIDRCEIRQAAVELHLPLIELFLLLAVLKFSIKDDDDKTEKKNLENPVLPDA